MKPTRPLVLALAGLLLGIAGAQESKDVVIGGQIVARVRDKGRYEDLATRSAQIDKWINEVISYEDTQHPKLSVARKNGVLHIYCVKRPVIDIYPGDAAPQHLTDAALGQLWLRNIKAALPRATPMSKLPPPPAGATAGGAVSGPRIPTAPSTGGTTGTSVAERPPANPGSGPVTGRAPQTPGVSTTPAGAGPARPEGGEKLPEPAKTPRSAALLLLFDAFQNVRALSEEEYLAGRDGLASNLLANLEPFMQEARSTGEAAGTPQPPRPPLIEVVPREPAITPPKPPVLPPKPPTPAVTPGVPRIPSVPSAPTVPAGGGAVKPAPTAPAAGSSTNRVPQKQRIGRKFAAAEQPFLALKTNNDPKAEEAATLLADSRKAFAAGDFDTSEAKVDEALRLMGVPIPQ